VREPPTDLPADALRDSLRREYGLPIERVEFLPLGHDSGAWVYRASTSDRSYFVKVRRRITNTAALAVPHFLRESGVDRVVAPLTTAAGELSSDAGEYAVVVYPFVSTMTGMSHGMSDEQWREYGRVVRAVHETSPTPAIATLLRVDEFRPDGAAALRRVGAVVSAPRFDDPGEEATVAVFEERREQIDTLLARAEALGSEVAAARLPLVLCHADIHTNNVLVDGDRDIWIADWDETMLAPRERDLMFVIGGIRRDFVDARREALFFEGYGEMNIVATAIAYYRYSWAVSDLASYGEQIFLRPDLGAVDRAEAVARFASLFDPGSIVDIAFDRRLQ
jgi:spectinomycin phosphotransferase